MRPNTNHKADPEDGLERRYTWTDVSKTPEIIEQYIANNWFEAHWLQLAERARDLLKAEIDQSDLQAIVNCRAKQEKSLREKLKMRYEEKHYRTIDDIRNDLFDLAGVRVILIVPTPEQHRKVKNIIRSIWGSDVEEKTHEGSAQSSTYKARHLGYQAVHYRPFMLEGQGDAKYKFKPNDRVEIQVVSALGNAWAEAGHDVLYKTNAYGEPTMAEHRILDALNGLVRSGELLLEQFHEAFLKRTKTKWEHHVEMRMFLHELDILQKQEQRNKFGDPGLDILFRFLTQTDKHYPLAVRNAIKDLGYGKKPEDLQLDDIIVSLEPAELDIADNMRATLCLIYRIMADQKIAEVRELCPLYELSKIEPSDVPKCCSIMITALTLLQDFLGGPHRAKTLLENLSMEITEDEKKRMTDSERQDLTADIEKKIVEERKRGLEWILADSSRQIALEETHKEALEKALPYLQPLWIWFRAQTENPVSIFRLCFRLAQMRAGEDVDPYNLLMQLRIGSLSRASTFSHEEEGAREE